MHQLTSPGPLPRADRAAAARARARRCCSRARSSPPRPRSCTSPTTSRSWPSGAQGAPRVPGPVPRAWPGRRCRRARRPGGPATRSSAASSTSPSADGTRSVYALHRDLLRLRRGGPGVSRAAGRTASTAPCSAGRRSCCASSAGIRTATTGCCSSTWDATCRASPRRPSRCSRRRGGREWRVALVERGPALRRSVERSPCDTQDEWRIRRGRRVGLEPIARRRARTPVTAGRP